MTSAHESSDTLQRFGPDRRRDWITNYVLEHGSVLVDDLTELFGVSRMTIHRDLDYLQDQGVLRKVRTGATAQPSNLFESDVRYRIRQQVKEKEAIARAALAHIEPGQAVLLDEATTLLPLARLLPSVVPLTVITNFLPIINLLTEVKGIQLITLGGKYFPRFDTFTGAVTEQTVSSLRADAYFTSVTATEKGMLFHPEEQIIKVKHAMMRNASTKYILMDHSKFGKVALHPVGHIRDFDCLIVDSGLDERYLKPLQDDGVTVEIGQIEA